MIYKNCDKCKEQTKRKDIKKIRGKYYCPKCAIELRKEQTNFILKCAGGGKSDRTLLYSLLRNALRGD